MSNTFGSIHIRTNNIDAVKKSLKQFDREKQNPIFPINELSNEIQSIIGEFMSFMGQMNNQYLIGLLDKDYVTILHYDFENNFVHQAAQKLSKDFVEPVLSMNYFDDCLLEISLIQKGKIITKHVSSYLEDEKPKMGNVIKFIKVLDLNISSNELKRILALDDLEEKVYKLEELLHIPLWIGMDHVNLSEDVYKKFEVIKFNK